MPNQEQITRKFINVLRSQVPKVTTYDNRQTIQYPNGITLNLPIQQSSIVATRRGTFS